MRSVEVISTPAPSPRRQVFRQEAIRAYAEANNRPVLPRFTTPFTIACCWLLVVLLGAGAVLVLSTRVPLTTSGMAIVAGGYDGGEGKATVLVVLPPDHAAAMQPGDEVMVRFGAHANNQPLVSLVEAPISADVIGERFGLDAETAGAIAPRSSVGVVLVDSLPSHLYPTAIGQAEIEVGTQRLAAVLPLIGRFFS